VVPVSPRHAILAAWAVLGVAAVGLQAAAARWRGRVPGMGTLVARVTERRWAAVVLILAWMWLGWHAFAR